MEPSGTRTQNVSLESGAVPACPFPAGTLIVRVCRAVNLFVHCAHFIALSNPFHYNINKIFIGVPSRKRGQRARPPSEIEK